MQTPSVSLNNGGGEQESRAPPAPRRQVIGGPERDVPRPREGREGVAPPSPRWGAAGSRPPPTPRAGRSGPLAAACLSWERLPKPASLRFGADSDVGKKEAALPSERAETTTKPRLTTQPPRPPTQQNREVNSQLTERRVHTRSVPAPAPQVTLGPLESQGTRNVLFGKLMLSPPSRCTERKGVPGKKQAL